MPANEPVQVKTRTMEKYLATGNSGVQRAVGKIASAVQAAAIHSIQTVQKDRENISDTTDYLDGVLSEQLGISLVEEIEDISSLAQELETFFDQAVFRQTFPDIYEDLEEKFEQIRLREAELKQMETDLETIIQEKVEEAKKSAQLHLTTSQGLFESALQKADKVIDQNKITRFVCSTITRFQDEFEQIQKTRDVEHVTRIFQNTIEPFQLTKVVADKDGKLTKIIINSFSDDCYQDLFFFFYRYYNELMDIYEKEGTLPPTADELARIFKKKKKGAEQIIAQMHSRKTPKQS